MLGAWVRQRAIVLCFGPKFGVYMYNVLCICIAHPVYGNQCFTRVCEKTVVLAVEIDEDLEGSA